MEPGKHEKCRNKIMLHWKEEEEKEVMRDVGVQSQPFGRWSGKRSGWASYSCHVFIPLGGSIHSSIPKLRDPGSNYISCAGIKEKLIDKL